MEVVCRTQARQAIGTLLRSYPHSETLMRWYVPPHSTLLAQPSRVIAANDHCEGVFKTSGRGDSDAHSEGVGRRTASRNLLGISIYRLFEDCCQRCRPCIHVRHHASGDERRVMQLLGGCSKRCSTWKRIPTFHSRAAVRRGSPAPRGSLGDDDRMIGRGGGQLGGDTESKTKRRHLTCTSIVGVRRVQQRLSSVSAARASRRRESSASTRCGSDRG